MSTDKDRLQNQTASAQNINDLLPFLKCIPMDKLRDFVHQNIEEMNQSQLKTMHSNAISINRIIPGDIIQHIISFQVLELENVKCVNKQWNKLSKQHERNYYLPLRSPESWPERHSLWKYINNDPQIFILHPKRTQLTEIERQCGFKGPINCIEDAIDESMFA